MILFFLLFCSWIFRLFKKVHIFVKIARHLTLGSAYIVWIMMRRHSMTVKCALAPAQYSNFYLFSSFPFMKNSYDIYDYTKHSDTNNPFSIPIAWRVYYKWYASKPNKHEHVARTYACTVDVWNKLTGIMKKKT